MSPTLALASAHLEERREVGTYEKTFVVDGVEYELYAQSDGDERVYQLVDTHGRVVADELPDVPDEETVAALVRANASPEAA